jgi:hypothetical protein
MSNTPAAQALTTNSGNKLHYSSRFMRRGKAFAWGPAFEESEQDKRTRRRLKRALEAVFPDAATEAGSAPPPNILESEKRRDAKRARREQARDYQLPHLRSPSPPTSTAKLAPGLAIPQTYTEIMMSSHMRHTLADDKMDRSLVDTSNELLESEKGLMQALGRLREVLRLRHRDVDYSFPELVKRTVNGDGEQGDGGLKKEGAMGENDEEPMDPDYMTPPTIGSKPLSMEERAFLQSKKRIPPLPRIAETDNLWRVTQEMLSSAQPTPTIEYSVTKPGTAAPSPLDYDGANAAKIAASLTPVQRLFVAKSGITLSAIPSTSQPGMLAENPLHRPTPVRYNIDLPSQTRAVDDALERIMELLVDCNEYKERLEETRDRVADIARVRKRVWSVIKDRTGRELEQNDRERDR